MRERKREGRQSNLVCLVSVGWFLQAANRRTEEEALDVTGGCFSLRSSASPEEREDEKREREEQKGGNGKSAEVGETEGRVGEGERRGSLAMPQWQAR